MPPKRRSAARHSAVAPTRRAGKEKAEQKRASLMQAFDDLAGQLRELSGAMEQALDDCEELHLQHGEEREHRAVALDLAFDSRIAEVQEAHGLSMAVDDSHVQAPPQAAAAPASAVAQAPPDASAFALMQEQVAKLTAQLNAQAAEREGEVVAKARFRAVLPGVPRSAELKRPSLDAAQARECAAAFYCLQHWQQRGGIDAFSLDDLAQAAGLADAAAMVGFLMGRAAPLFWPSGVQTGEVVPRQAVTLLFENLSSMVDLFPQVDDAVAKGEAAFAALACPRGLKRKPE